MAKIRVMKLTACRWNGTDIKKEYLTALRKAHF